MPPAELNVKGNALVCSGCISLEGVQHLLAIPDVPTVHASILAGPSVQEVAISREPDLQRQAHDCLHCQHYIPEEPFLSPFWLKADQCLGCYGRGASAYQH